MIDKYLMHMQKKLVKVRINESNKKDTQEAQRRPGMYHD